MEQFLSLVGMQAMKLAVRSGIIFTSSYALKQYAHFLTTVKDGQLLDELKSLQAELDSKIKIITPAINLIELKSGQGNSALESALTLTASLHNEITLLGHKIAALTPLQTCEAATSHLIVDIRALLHRMNDSIPLLQLAISASGESLSSNLPDSVSPSRMLQASAFLMIADSHFTAKAQTKIQAGPDFMVSVYMVFKGYSNELSEKPNSNANPQKRDLNGVRKPMWQEVLHKARLRVYRTPHRQTQKEQDGLLGPSVYSYDLEIKEDRDDGRVHDDSEITAESSESEMIPITKISKMLYTNSAAILNIKNDLEAYSTPILLLKRELDATDPCDAPSFETPDAETQHRIDCQILSECNDTTPHSPIGDSNAQALYSSGFPSYLDPEWIALEMYTKDATDESQFDESDAESTLTCSDEFEQETSRDAATSGAMSQLSSLSLERDSSQQSEDTTPIRETSTSLSQGVPNTLFSMVTTSLSLLELVIRLAVLQETQQKSHLSIPDHVLTSFLNGTVRSENAANSDQPE
ncbi:hypothetical protein LLEC1_04545 [Akanthomyces lecanii]|uniref:Ran-binding-domain-containing protein n=1 Tax=Cordyceps confragosa TaxID=2714763 RepID=A0A179IMT2_CORDF|nr:hypothetical protein LLEC1_04545 [Akanthomyces lecanii]